jgi:hypothetical protein
MGKRCELRRSAIGGDTGSAKINHDCKAQATYTTVNRIRTFLLVDGMRPRALKGFQRIATARLWTSQSYSTTVHDGLSDVDSVTKIPGEEAIKSDRSQNSLPLSTYFDPARLSQRYRHRSKKETTPNQSNLDAFRQGVAINPYGKYSRRQEDL